MKKQESQKNAFEDKKNGRAISDGDVARAFVSSHSHTVNEVAASLAMSGMPLTESEKDDLEAFQNMTEEEQEQNIEELVERYRKPGMEGLDK